MNEKDKNLALRKKLTLVSELETRHGLLGVSFAVRPGAKVLTQDSVDYVIKVIETAVKDIDELDSIPAFIPEGVVAEAKA